MPWGGREVERGASCCESNETISCMKRSMSTRVNFNERRLGDGAEGGGKIALSRKTLIRGKVALFLP